MERNCELPPGVVAGAKAATREMVAAMGSATQTGPQAVEALTGHSGGTISRWGRLGYPEMIPLAVVLHLEMLSGLPIFARFLASLTGHELQRLDAAEGDGAGLVERVVRVGATHGAFALEAMTAAADGRVTPAEAVRTLAAARRLQAELGEAVARLAAIAEGGEG